MGMYCRELFWGKEKGIDHDCEEAHLHGDAGGRECADECIGNARGADDAAHEVWVLVVLGS